MELIVKRSELGGLGKMIETAQADSSYAGSATFGGSLADGTFQTITVTIQDESAS